MKWYREASMPGLNTLMWPREGWGSACPSQATPQLVWDQQELCGDEAPARGSDPCLRQHDVPHAPLIRRQTTWSSKRVTETLLSPFFSCLTLVWHIAKVLFPPFPLVSIPFGCETQRTLPQTGGAKAQQGSEHCPAPAIICLKPPKKGDGISLPAYQSHWASFSPATAFPIISSGSGWEESQIVCFMVPSFLMNH